MLKRIFFTLFFVLALCIIGYYIFSPLYTTNYIIVDYGLHSFNICSEQPLIWHYCKIWFCLSYVFSSLYISNMLYHLFFKKSKHKKSNFLYSKEKTKKDNNYSLISSSFSPQLKLLIGEDAEAKQQIYIPEKSLYQNILITGTIGTGKTSSAMYPFTKQLIEGIRVC